MTRIYMSNESKGESSETERNYDVSLETLLGVEQHRTRITDTDGDTYTGHGTTSEASQSDASDKFESGNADCCFITTACLEDLGYNPSETEEMRAMKIVTKNHVLKSRAGMRDYIKYGRIAPGIVAAIRGRGDTEQIWRRVYEKLKDVSIAVFEGDLDKGYQRYKALVNELTSFVPQ